MHTRAQRRYPKWSMLMLLLLLLLCSSSITRTCHGWEWSDFVVGGGTSSSSSSSTLTFQQVSEMRVRDVKRRLARQHGYSAEELAKILDKKELIEALAYEEYKIRQVQIDAHRRKMAKNGILVAIVAVVLVLFWPLLTHVHEVAHVNFVVYIDRKRHEATRCYELQSIKAGMGIALMFILDVLGLWLTVSVLLSWVIPRNKYFFPMPSLPIRPAAMMGGEVSQGPLAKYGLNVGPMVVTWLLRFLHGKVENWTGRALSQAHQQQQKAYKKAKRDKETPEEREARRAARKARRAAEKQQKEAAAMAAAQRKQQQRSGNNPSPSAPTTTQPPSREEMRNAAAWAAEARGNSSSTNGDADYSEPKVEVHTVMDELD